MSSEKFCLKWNDFEANISSAFRELRDDKDFFDVTLACDEEQINAHKVILSACSPFFRNVLKRNPHQNPLLYMKGVRFQDLVSVLNFMYHGEVNVAQEDLNNFLAVAEDLRVKGLTQNQAGGSGGSSSSSSRQNVKPQPEPYKPKSEVKRSVIPSRPSASSAVVQDDDDIQEVVPVKTEPAPSQVDYQDPNHSQNQQLQQFEGDMQYEEGYDDYGQYDDSAIVEGTPGHDAAKGQFEGRTALKPFENLDEACEKGLQKTGPGQILCLFCGKVSPSWSHGRHHVEAKHVETQGYVCDLCNQYCKTKHALDCHMSRHHRNHLICS